MGGGQENIQEADLLAAIHDNPDADEPRLVYCDWLLERGDPRGEFIALQYKRHRGESLTPEQSRRERALLRERLRAWMGPLYAVTYVKHNTFERGFLERCTFQPRGAATHKVVNHPAWATVRDLAMIIASNDTGAAVVTAPAMRHLRTLRHCPSEVLGLLSETEDFRLETVIAPLLAKDDGWARFLDAKGLPSLKAIEHVNGMSPAMLEMLLKSPRARRLSRISFNVHDAAAERPFIDVANSVAPPASLTITFLNFAFTHVLHREKNGRFESR
jgi:uncharacterized protein (TIGR02996 family)